MASGMRIRRKLLALLVPAIAERRLLPTRLPHAARPPQATQTRPGDFSIAGTTKSLAGLAPLRGGGGVRQVWALFWGVIQATASSG